MQDASALDSRLRIQRDALTIPRIGGKIDHTHEVGFFREIEPMLTERKISDGNRSRVAVFLVQGRKRGEVEHPASLDSMQALCNEDGSCHTVRSKIRWLRHRRCFFRA